MNQSAKDAPSPSYGRGECEMTPRNQQSLGVLGMFGGALKAKQPAPFESGCC